MWILNRQLLVLSQRPRVMIICTHEENNFVANKGKKVELRALFLTINACIYKEIEDKNEILFDSIKLCLYSVCYILQSYWQKTTSPNRNKDITQLIRWNGQLRLVAAKDDLRGFEQRGEVILQPPVASTVEYQQWQKWQWKKRVGTWNWSWRVHLGHTRMKELHGAICLSINIFTWMMHRGHGLGLLIQTVVFK